MSPNTIIPVVMTAATFVSSGAVAAMINVPDDQPTIQDAIDVAVSGVDEVVVAPGTYVESIDLLGKAITVRSSGGAAVTIIDGNNAFRPVQCINGEGPDTVLDGFTITRGLASGPANDRGGGMYNLNSSPTVLNCTFSDNVAMHSGGGMYTQWGDPTVANCTFTGNSAHAGGGGGMYNWTADATVTACTFSGNTIAAGSGAAMNNHIGADVTVINCVFSGNATSSSGSGAGIMNNDGDLVLVNSTFIDNTGGWFAGGLFNAGTLTMSNCVFYENSCTFNGGAIYNQSDTTTTLCNSIFRANSPNEIHVVEGAPTVSYSNVQGGWAGAGEGNIDMDPLFADADGRLSPDSPCIDAGHNWTIAGLADTDLDGNPRIANGPAPDTGCGIPAVVDIGAYEYPGESFDVLLGDIDGDGAVGVTDFLLMLGAWGACSDPCCLPDLDLNGDVGISDFLILLASWG